MDSRGLRVGRGRVAIGAEDLEQPADIRTQAATLDDRVQVAQPIVRFSKPEIVGQLLASDRLLDHAGPVNASRAPGSEIVTSPRLAKLARTPAVVGCVITGMNAQRASRSRSIAHTVLGICMRDKSLLHAGASGCGHADKRNLSIGCVLACPPQLLADDATHRSAHE